MMAAHDASGGAGLAPVALDSSSALFASTDDDNKPNNLWGNMAAMAGLKIFDSEENLPNRCFMVGYILGLFKSV
jgi:hypothetical protein